MYASHFDIVRTPQTTVAGNVHYFRMVTPYSSRREVKVVGLYSVYTNMHPSTQLFGPRFSSSGMVFFVWYPYCGMTEPLNVTGLRQPSSLGALQNSSYAEGKACCRITLGKQAVAMAIAEA